MFRSGTNRQRPHTLKTLLGNNRLLQVQNHADLTSEIWQLKSQCDICSKYLRSLINYSPQVSITLSEVSTSESLTGAQSVAHTGYRYMRHPPEIINLPVPVGNPSNDDLPHVMWKKFSRKKGPPDSFGQETLRAQRTNVSKHVEENVRIKLPIIF